jgi:hypothetical protein
MTITDSGLVDPSSAGEAPVADNSTPVEPAVEAPPADAVPTEPAGDEPLYAVTVQGEEQQVTLEELRGGYMRQSDYTKKTQGLSQREKELANAEAVWTALERNPERTIEILMDQFGLSPQQAAAAASAPEQEPYGGHEDTPPDPMASRLEHIEQHLAQIRQRDMQSQIDAEFQALEAEHGQIDRQALLNHTVKRGLPDLAAGYRDMNFDTARQTAVRVDAKREAQVVQDGGTVAPKSVSAPPQKQLSLREQIAASLKQHGVT